MFLLLLLPLLAFAQIRRQEELTSILGNEDLYMAKQFIDAITAYGPGVGVYTPYSYVDWSYDNIPFAGKVIPILGKEGTASRLGISPFYPANGHPSNPLPPLYKARPLPLHVPEPVDVVAVPLDEEALHGEPLFPKELVLPAFMDMAGTPPPEETDDAKVPPASPFDLVDSNAFEKAEIEESVNENQIAEDMVIWPSGFSSVVFTRDTSNEIKEATETIIQDSVKEKNMKMEEMNSEKHNEPVPMGDGKGSRGRRIKRLAEILA